jgi:hypothetical protein
LLENLDLEVGLQNYLNNSPFQGEDLTQLANQARVNRLLHVRLVSIGARKTL